MRFGRRCGFVRAAASTRDTQAIVVRRTRDWRSARARIPPHFSDFDSLPGAGQNVIDYGCGSGILGIAH